MTDRARELAHEIARRHYSDAILAHELAQEIEPFIRAARREAMEEAAKIADSNAHEECEVAEVIAAAIRKLMEESNGV